MLIIANAFLFVICEMKKEQGILDCRTASVCKFEWIVPRGVVFLLKLILLLIAKNFPFYYEELCAPPV